MAAEEGVVQPHFEPEQNQGDALDALCAGAAGTEAPAAETYPNGSAVQLPFEPPEQVKKWLRPQDWEALTKAWEDAEAQAFAWAEDESQGVDEMWQDGASLQDSSLLTAGNSIMTQQSGRSLGGRRKKQMPPWREDFVVQTDANRPPPLRRYFDPLVAETSQPRQAIRPEIARLHGPNRPKSDIWSIWHPTFQPDISEATARRLARSQAGNEEVLREQREAGWCDEWWMSVSVDNDRLNPLNRHYFDRRGLESSYRQRPKLDAITPKMRPGTPGPCLPRPTTREKILGKQRSAPQLTLKKGQVDASKRGDGDITWGRRCIMFGADPETRMGIDGSKIPWVNDHNRMEAEDNAILPPLLRHYFEREGLESSFRQRGRHYGRPLKVGLGIPPISTDPPLPGGSSQGSEAGNATGSRLSSSRTSLSQFRAVGSGPGTPTGANSDAEVLRPSWTRQQVKGRLRDMLMEAQATYGLEDGSEGEQAPQEEEEEEEEVVEKAPTPPPEKFSEEWQQRWDALPAC